MRMADYNYDGKVFDLDEVFMPTNSNRILKSVLIAEN